MHDVTKDFKETNYFDIDCKINSLRASEALQKLFPLCYIDKHSKKQHIAEVDFIRPASCWASEADLKQ